MESLHGPVILALLMAGGIGYYFLEVRHPHAEDHEGAVAEAPPSHPRTRTVEMPAAVPSAPVPMPAPTAAVAPTPAPPPPGPPDCVANIETDPPGASVFWGSLPLGKTPVSRVAVPCGPARLALKHALFSDVDRDVIAVQGTPFNVSEKLTPGHARLTLSSSPLGATFSVGGTVVGTGNPTYHGTIGDEVTVTAALEGHKPWSRTVKLSTRRMNLTAPLEPK